ncbi:MAG: hypothetical protein HY074_10755 [Deltaproteobacteria bacterium]|nr:hypothetical protein [Deltaproteobacteria bacterium]
MKHRLALKDSKWRDAAVFLPILVLSSVYLARNALAVLDFFDMSAFMDAGYRIARGQAPYTDFFYSAGPLHPLMHAIYFKLFGFTKTAIQAHLLTVNALALTMTFVIARRRLPLWQAGLVTVLGSFCFYGPVSHPWYDQNAAVFVIFAVLACELLRTSKNELVKAALAFAAGGAVTAAFMVKANFGASAACVLLVVLLVSRVRPSLVAVYLLGCVVVLGVVLLALKSPAEYYYQTFVAFPTRGRMGDIRRIMSVSVRTPYTMLLLALFGAVPALGLKFFRKNIELFTLLAGLLAISIFTSWTGSMLVSNNLCLLALEMAYCFALINLLKRKRLQGAMLVGLTIALTALFTVESVYKTVNTKVWSWRRPVVLRDYALKTEAFRGWRCDRRIGEGLDAAVDFISHNVGAGESLFVYPDATVIYGLTGHESYRNAPFIFHLGMVPAPGRILEKFRKDLFAAPPAWIVIHDQTEVSFIDTKAMTSWLQLGEFFENNYRQVWTSNPFRVLKRLRASK